MNAEPIIKIPVDLTNPGQFFGCCGLLELAGRLWPGAEGWFELGEFRLAGGGSLTAILETLVGCEVEEILNIGNLEVKPLIAPLRLTHESDGLELILDAWMTVRPDRDGPMATGNPPWNFWSGQQTSLRIWNPLRAALQSQLRSLDSEGLREIFSRRAPLSGRFGFDPGAAWNALDAGFSPNEQKLSVASSPAVELLAAVGVQRFRPVVADRTTFEYCTWGLPLPLSVAAAAAMGAIPCPPSRRYRGRVVSRGSYAALGFSTLLQGENDVET